jgi:hypothetical protein
MGSQRQRHRAVTGLPAAGARMLALLCASSWVLVLTTAQNYSAIFNFGDSITDTGNLCTSGRPSQITFTQPPYGETYFGTPTCRCSDGRVVVDFLSACSVVRFSSWIETYVVRVSLLWADA